MDRRIKRTRQFIKRALIQLIAEKSFHTITIQDITERGDRSCSEKPTESYVDYDPVPFFIRMFEHIGKHAEFYRVMLQELPVFGRRVSDVIQQLYKDSISIMQPDEHQFIVRKIC